MMFEILSILVVLLIAVPFVYIFVDVIYDLSRRAVVFFQNELKPMPVRVRTDRERRKR